MTMPLTQAIQQCDDDDAKRCKKKEVSIVDGRRNVSSEKGGR